MHKRNKILLFFAAASILLVSLPTVFASSGKSFIVFPGMQTMVEVDLDDGSYVSGAFLVSSSDYTSDIIFWVTNPNNDTILDLGLVNKTSTFNFTAHGAGAYTLHFGHPGTHNYLSPVSSARSVWLEAEIPTQFSTILFFSLIIAGIGSVIGVGIYLNAKRKKTKMANASLQNLPSELQPKIKEVDSNVKVISVLSIIGIMILMGSFILLSMSYNTLQDLSFRYPFLEFITDQTTNVFVFFISLIFTLIMVSFLIYYTKKRKSLLSKASINK